MASPKPLPFDLSDPARPAASLDNMASTESFRRKIARLAAEETLLEQEEAREELARVRANAALAEPAPTLSSRQRDLIRAMVLGNVLGPPPGLRSHRRPRIR